MARLILNTAEFVGAVSGMVSRATNPRPAVMLWGLDVMRDVQGNFAAGGRPDPWAALKPETVYRRITRGNREKKNKRKVMTVAKGAAGGAIQSVMMANGGFAYSEAGKAFTRGATRALAGAKILQDRGDLKASINMDVSNLMVHVGSALKYAATHQFGDAERNIPARPYLVMMPGTAERFPLYLARHIAGTLK